MYNDNLESIRSLTQMMQSVYERNVNIQNALVQILNPSNNRRVSTTHARNDNARNDNARNDNARNDNARNHNARNDNARNHNARNDNARNDNARNDNARNDTLSRRVNRASDDTSYYVVDFITRFNNNYTNANANANNENNINNINNTAFHDILNTFLQPIDIYPSNSQIENATRIVNYRNIISPANTSCPISMDTFSNEDNVMMIRHCGHLFKCESIMNWFETHCTCPVCRYDIRNYRQGIVDVSNNSH
jgi:hypothetical protein